MLDITRDIDSLSNFKRRTAEFIRQMRQTGQPVVLTINGKAELVVQDARAYQRVLEMVERLATAQAIMEGLADVDAGRTQPAGAALQELRRKHGV